MMFLHVGGDRMVPVRDIVGIFDTHTASKSKYTKEFLELARAENSIDVLPEHEEKTFVITDDRTYVSPISSLTLAKRVPSAIDHSETDNGQTS